MNLDASDAPAWRPARIIVVGGLAVAPYFLLGGRLVADLYWSAVATAMLVTAMRVVVLRGGPARAAWLLVLVGHALFVVGDFAFMVVERTASEASWAVSADICYLAGYIPLTVGTYLLLHARRPARELGAIVDGLIAGVVTGVVIWAFFIGPAAAADSGAEPLERIVNLSYPTMDVVVAVVALQLLARAPRSVPLRLFSGSIGAVLLADLWYFDLANTDAYTTGHPVDLSFWMGYVLAVAAATASPGSMLRESEHDRTTELGAVRLVSLAAVSVLPPAVILVRSAAGVTDGLPVLAAGSIAIFVLVVARLAVTANDLDRSRARALHEASHDGLTGLANRSRFAAETQRSLTSPHRPGRAAVLMCIDLDDFKTVNDSLGHVAGDELLVEVGARLSAEVGPDDLVARLGGDEFAVLLRDRTLDDAVATAERMLHRVREPVRLGDDVVVRTTASLGIAVGEPGRLPESVVRDADVAMYHAKQAGKCRWEVYRPGMGQLVVDRFALLSDLGSAVERGQLRAVYQPIVRVDDGATAGLEALIRWEHPEHGMIAPGRFIPLAEESGLITMLGEWMLQRACHDAVAFDHDDGGVFVSVNVSATQLERDDLPRQVADALRSSGLAPARLVVELTESTAIADLAEAADRLAEVRAQGVRVALDDFGAGYTSLRHLQLLPVDVVKFDQSFIRSADHGHERLLHEVTRMTRSLGILTVGEGIEDETQLERVRSAGCDLAQGFWFSKPAPIADIVPAGGAVHPKS